MKPGIYKHFRNLKEYEFICLAKNESDQTDLVIYRALYDDRSIWARPLEVFNQMVSEGGLEQPRFKWIRDKE
jgi:hypothetical protein